MDISKTFIFLGLTFSLLVISCSKPIVKDSGVTATNTFTSDAFTAGEEVAIEALFQVDAGSLAATATVNDEIEFPAYLLGLYDIDIDRKKIKFDVVAQADDVTYGDLFRVLEAGTTDRYYFTFDEAQNVEDFESDNDAVKLRIDSDRILVVEIGEGFDFKPGAAFTIKLK